MGGLPVSNMPKRYCTMPKIPWFRDWFEAKFGDLCEKHDLQYASITTVEDKIQSDFWFAKEVALRGYMFLAILSLIAFQLPWVGRVK